MSDQKHTFAAPVKAPDCWDWIRPEDVVRHALAAFYWACNNVKAPKGEKFLGVDGRPYADRETFADCMTHFFDLRIKAEAHSIGIGDYAPEAKMLERCTQHAPCRSRSLSTKPTGRRPGDPPSLATNRGVGAGEPVGACGQAALVVSASRLEIHANTQ